MKEWNGILVIGEMVKGEIHKVTYELIGKGRELADDSACKLSCLLLCAKGDSYKDVNAYGVDRTYIMVSESFSKPEEVLYKMNIVRFIREYKPAVVLLGATEFGRSLAPRIAAALGTGLTADCTDLVIGGKGELIQVRPAFSDNILAHITTRNYPQMATVRYGEFSIPSSDETACDESSRDMSCSGEVVKLSAYVEEYLGTRVLEMVDKKARDITESDIIVACGRGVKNVEDIALIRELADTLGGQVGYSRALVDAGMVDANNQIGYSGLRVKPKLYIACGISGAPQHLAGMKESGRIIAINRDASAPIFEICDIGYVGDLYEVIPRLIKQLKEGN